MKCACGGSGGMSGLVAFSGVLYVGSRGRSEVNGHREESFLLRAKISLAHRFSVYTAEGYKADRFAGSDVASRPPLNAWAAPSTRPLLPISWPTCIL